MRVLPFSFGDPIVANERSDLFETLNDRRCARKPPEPQRLKRIKARSNRLCAFFGFLNSFVATLP